jgi:hypothetical protein
MPCMLFAAGITGMAQCALRRALERRGRRRVQHGVGELAPIFDSSGISIDLYYVDGAARPWQVPIQYVYRNHEAEFEPALVDTGTPFESLEAMAEHIAATADVAWPVATGAFAESGAVHAALEAAEVDYVGCRSESAAVAAHKARCRAELDESGFPVLHQLPLAKDDFDDSGRLTVRSLVYMVSREQDRRRFACAAWKLISPPRTCA